VHPLHAAKDARFLSGYGVLQRREPRILSFISFHKSYSSLPGAVITRGLKSRKDFFSNGQLKMNVADKSTTPAIEETSSVPKEQSTRVNDDVF
jgi:hypothetical protein